MSLSMTLYTYCLVLGNRLDMTGKTVNWDVKRQLLQTTDRPKFIASNQWEESIILAHLIRISEMLPLDKKQQPYLTHAI